MLCSSRRLAALALVGLVPAVPVAAALPGDVADEARAAFERKDWEAAARLATDYVVRGGDDPELRRMLGLALLQLERRDEAAWHLEEAARAFAAAGDERLERRVRAELQKADPLSSRRARFFRELTTSLFAAAERLHDSGHEERALALLEAVLPVATGKDAAEVRRLHEEVRAAFEEVDLDAAGDANESGVRPLLEHESEHYRFQANLERDVVERLGRTMDSVHAFYVKVYFDGDERAAAAPKATIRIHPDWDSMAREWAGGPGSAPQGWWSPGENRVVCYDTRSNAGTLDVMLETLFHEASHQFMTLLSRRGGGTPAWLNEGTASFFEGTVAMADDRVLWPDAALGRLTSLSFMLESEDSTPSSVAEVVGYSAPGSYPASYYAWGWGLVFFLQQYEDPETLAYVYRPLYARYRETMTTKGGDSLELFRDVFLGDASPLGHRTLEEFERDWRAWILEEVRPLHLASRPERRTLRLTAARRYLDAADAAAGRRKAPVGEAELLERALGHLDYVRREIDGDEHPDGELLLREAEVMRRLERPAAEAPLLEAVLDLADEGRFILDEERYAEIEKRLKRLDSRNWALRNARSKIRGLTRRARRLLDEYRDEERGLLLRAYTFAAEAGAALGDEEVLLPAAAELRAAAREAGLLLGRVVPLAPGRPDTGWTTPMTATPKRFETRRDRIELESVRTLVFWNGELDLGSDYEVRGRIVRRGELHLGSAHGLFACGTDDGDGYLVGLTREGDLAVWRLLRLGGGGVRPKRIARIPLDPPVGPDESPLLATRVLGGRRLSIRVGERPPVEVDLPEPVRGISRAGLFVKDGTLLLEDPVVEIYP